MNKEQYWNRKCILDGCNNLAKPLSEYCKKHFKEMKTKLEESNNDKE